MDELKRGTKLRIVIVEAKNLHALDSVLSIAKYRDISKTKIEGFAVHGFFRKRYYAIVTGIQRDLEIIVAYAKRSTQVEAYYSKMLNGQVYNHITEEWEPQDDSLLRAHL